VKVAVLTGGQDPHYAHGLLRALLAQGVCVAFIAGDELTHCQDGKVSGLEFYNFVGSQDPNDGLIAKVWRVLRYYWHVVIFAARTDARVFHILWVRRFPYAERTLLNACFKLLGKKLVFTAHNVDDESRDGRKASLVNEASLRFQYRVADHIFVHTQRMKRQLLDGFGVSGEKVSVVPFGLNDIIPASSVNQSAARQRLELKLDERVLLFFGQIAPYKGVEDLLRALAILAREDGRFSVVLAGRVKESCEAYWATLERLIKELHLSKYVRTQIRYIPDE
jgi:D-inositol-3-phosphate glycosyltransferase